MVERKRVMWLIKGLGAGGAEKLLEIALPFLDRDRFDYEIGYLLPWKNALVPAFEEAGIPVHCLNHRRPYDLRVLPQLAGLLRQRRTDLLHLHLPYTGILGRVAGKLSPVKAVVYTEHNLWERYHRLTSVANRLTYGLNDAVVAVSNEVEQSIRAGYRQNGKPVLKTILNGVDVDRLAMVSRDAKGVKEEFGIPSNHRLIVHVAHFTPKKRHVDLIQAAGMVVKQDPDTTFLLVGHGPLEAEIKAAVHQQGLKDNVLFAGFRTDAPRLIAASDLLVLCSQFEGLPISLLEAMALRRPVVATRVGGVPEVITDGVEGFVVEPLNPAGVAEKILEMLRNPELCQRFSENGFRRVEAQFGIRRMVESTEDLYDQVLATK